jgi:DNA repair exonuclease SbcCD nuclease subunit
MFKFLHAADLHLDSPLQGLDRYEGAPVARIRGATRLAVANLVDLALFERVKFVLIAGDVYDGNWRDYNTGLFFNQQMNRLGDAGIPVVIISGNHDAESDVTRSLTLPPHVVRLATDRPQTHVFDDLGVAVHGQGFATRAVLTNLAAAYPPAIGGLLNVGLLHSSVTISDGHERYAPCDLTDLRGKGYGYWALGHIHKRQHLLGGGDDPWVVFPGNVQGRHVREAGGKGASIVTVNNGVVESVEHRDLDVLRWDRLDVDATAAVDDEELLGRLAGAVKDRTTAAGGRTLAVRVRFVGACRTHASLVSDEDRWTAEVRSAATSASDGRAWVEQVRVHTSADTVPDAPFDPDGPAADVRAVLDELLAGGPALDLLAADLREFTRKLIPELRSGPDAVAPSEVDALKALLRQVAADELPALLAPQLAGVGSA